MSDKWPVARGEKGTTTNTTSKAKSYKELLVWQKGLVLVKIVYQLAARFPADERYGLVSQAAAGIRISAKLATRH